MTRPPKSPAPRRAGTAAPAADIDPQSYAAFVGDLKQRIIEARHRASLSVNREMILLYWTIGRDILTRQVREGWGAKVVDRLEAAGDVVRGASATDRRQSLVSLTDAGVAHVAPLLASARRHEASLLARFGQDQSALLKDALRELIEQMTHRP